MKTTMFPRILMGTLLPVLLVFIIVIATIRNIVYLNDTIYVKESVKLFSRQISEQTASKLESTAALQNNISMGLASIDFEQPEAKQSADRLLRTLLISDPKLYRAWFVFEPGVFPEDGYYYKTMLCAEDGVQEIPHLSDELLRDSSQSPWYHTPLSTGEVYMDVMGGYDYGLEEDVFSALTMSYPIVADHRVIGCIGVDIQYEDLFHMDSFTDEAREKIMLLSKDGKIVLSENEEEIGKSLWDYSFQEFAEISQALYGNSVWQEEIHSPFFNEKSLICLYPIEVHNKEQIFYLYQDIPVEAIYETFYPSMEIIVITSGLGLVLLALSVFFTTRNIVKHIQGITNSFQCVASSEGEGILDIENISLCQTNIIEIEILQSALLSMMKQLNKTQELKMQAIDAAIEKEKLIAASEAKTNFFATMSHEIRTPMNVIIGISEIMLHEGQLTQSQEKNIQDIKISSDALLNIINDILDVSKLETGKMSLKPEHYNFRAFINNVTSLATHLAGEAGLQFIFETDGELPLCLYGDEVRLRQVLLNLIGNAVKFTKEGFVSLSVFIENDTLHFDVADSGIGIAQKDIGAIFESFKRIDTRRNREVKGTGLGLSISRNLVELMAGTISVESIHGTGSTFSVVIPLALGDERKLRWKKTGTATRYSDSLKVLIVDDNEINLNVSSGLFWAIHRVRCDTAISGKEAIIKVQKIDYDIIFMDHMMPEFDGVDTTQYIRHLGGKYESIPIIALTANAVIGTKEELLNAGMNDFLAKPIQSERLQEILNTWVPEEKKLVNVEQSIKMNSDSMEKPKISAAEGFFVSFPGKALETEGVDTIVGLENIGHDEDMYLHSLCLLKEKIPQTIQLLFDLLEQQNMKEFLIHIHGMKGSLLSVGAVALSEYTKWLEVIASEDDVDRCKTLFPPLAEKLQKFCERLKEIIPDIQKHGKGRPCNTVQLNNALQRLCLVLESYDYETITKELQVILSMNCDPEKNENILKMKSMIDSFDYSEAIVLIREKLILDNF